MPRRLLTCARVLCRSTPSRAWPSIPAKQFADEGAWCDHLRRLGIDTLRHSHDAVRLASEGGLWGSIKAHGLLPDTVILSDDAGQFAVGQHALCWVHAERLVHELDTFTDADRAAQAHVRGLIWWFYRDLKAYCREPTARRSRRASTGSSGGAPGS